MGMEAGSICRWPSYSPWVCELINWFYTYHFGLLGSAGARLPARAGGGGASANFVGDLEVGVSLGDGVSDAFFYDEPAFVWRGEEGGLPGLWWSMV